MKTVHSNGFGLELEVLVLAHGFQYTLIDIEINIDVNMFASLSIYQQSSIYYLFPCSVY